MAKGFGIAALIVGLIAFGVPVFSLYVSWLAALLAMIAAFSGDRMFAVATSVLVVLNTVFFSPITMTTLLSDVSGGTPPLLILTIAIFAAPVVAMILNANGVFAARERDEF